MIRPMLVDEKFITSTKKPCNNANNGARETPLCWPDGRGKGEHNGIGFVDVYKILVMQDDGYFGTTPFEEVYNDM